jgi:hypothetical protein
MVKPARCTVVLAAAIVLFASIAAAQPKTKNIIFVMTDGLRWQEVFTGAEESLMTKENGGVTDIPGLKRAYWRETPEARREALMPFMWTVIAKSGQIYGNRNQGSEAYVTNGKNFSYPGYNETLSGFPDARIKSNDKIPNPNVTVLEWLNGKPAYQGKVAAFGAWDVFPFIFNSERAGFLVNAGYDPLTMLPDNARVDVMNQIRTEGPHVWPDEVFDPILFHTALEYLKEAKPRILYISLGETDEWAHAGKYALYLDSAHRADAHLKTLWETVQSMPEYRDQTTLIFTPDHGRGDAPVAWKSHGEKVPASKYIWMAFLGPDTPALSERTNIPAVTQNQIAATLAAFLGEDYPGSVAKAGPPIPGVSAPRP